MRYDSGRGVRAGRARREPVMTRPVVAFQIRGRNAAALQDFYKQLFGWQMKADNPMGVEVIADAEALRERDLVLEETNPF